MRIARGLTAVLVVCAVAHPAGAGPVEKLRDALALGAVDPNALRQGKLQSPTVPEVGDRDLAVGFMAWTRATPAALGRGFLDGVDLANGPNVETVRRLVSSTPAELEGVRLAVPASSEELGRYRTARPGDELNLSKEELAALAALGQLAGPTKVAAEVKRLLLARVAAYRARGLAGIAPYAREGSSQAVGDELRLLVTRMHLDAIAPGLGEAVLGYPRVPRFAFEEAYFLVVYKMDGRPVYALRHRLLLKVADGVAAVDRELYVSHAYDAMQAVALAYPDQGGTLVAYRAHSFTDRVAGMGSTAKHGVGRRMMATELEKVFERTRDKR